jgi:hypothetical protein
MEGGSERGAAALSRMQERPGFRSRAARGLDLVHYERVARLNRDAFSDAIAEVGALSMWMRAVCLYSREYPCELFDVPLAKALEEVRADG